MARKIEFKAVFGAMNPPKGSRNQRIRNCQPTSVRTAIRRTKLAAINGTSMGIRRSRRARQAGWGEGETK
jgi:hypothetical protein